MARHPQFTVKTVGVIAIQQDIARAAVEAGGYPKLARKVGCVHSLLFDVRHGRKLPPPLLLKHFGYTRTVEKAYRYVKAP